MNRRRVLAALFVTPVVVGALVACGGAPATPATAPAAGAPLYSQAKPLDSGSPMAVAMESIKEAAKKEQGADMKVDAYSLPADTKFEQVKKFYGDEMTKRGFKEVPTPSEATVPGGGSATWLKDDKEVLLIMVMPDPTASGGPILVVTHGNKK